MQLPWGAAPRSAWSSPLTMIVSGAAAFLLAFVVAASVLHSSASGSAALDYQLGNMCQQNQGPAVDGTDLSTAQADTVVRTARALGREHTTGTALAARYSGLFRPGFHGVKTWAKLGYRPGARDHLRVVRGGNRGGIWVPQSFARAAGVRLGDRGMNGALPPVTAIYQDMRAPVPPWWCTESSDVVRSPLAGDGQDAAVIWMPDRASFDRSASGAPVTVGVRFTGQPALETTGDVTARAERNDTVLADLNTALDGEGLGATVRLTNHLGKPAEIVRQAEDGVFTAILPLAGVSVLVGLVGVGSVTLQWCQRRYSELRLLWCRGAGPWPLGARALAELALPLTAGTIGGLVAARALLGWYAPATALDLTPNLVAAGAGLGTLVAAMGVVVGVTALRVHRQFQSRPGGATAAGDTAGRGGRSGTAGRLWRWVPWELGTAALAGASWQRLTEAADTGAPSPVPTVDPSALAFPMLVLLTVVLLVARATHLALRSSHRARWWSVPVLQLALRRLAAGRGPVTGVLLVGALGLGALVIGTAIADGQERALATKSGMFVGANSAVQVGHELGTGERDLPDTLAGNSTVVGVSRDANRTVLVVDADTFTKGAWLGHRSGEQLRNMLRELGATGSGEVRTISVGSAPRGTTGLPLLPDGTSVRHESSFPKIGGGPGYVLTRQSLSEEDAREVGAWFVWSQAPLHTVDRALTEAGIHHFSPESRQRALDGMPFLVVQWTFEFVAALGVLLAGVAALALLLAVEVRRKQNALAGTLMLRMGLRQRALFGSHLLELGALAILAVCTGVTVGAAGARISVPLLDPAPWLFPAAGMPDLTPLTLATLAGGTAVVVLAGWIAVRSTRSARVREVLRG